MIPCTFLFRIERFKKQTEQVDGRVVCSKHLQNSIFIKLYTSGLQELKLVSRTRTRPKVLDERKTDQTKL